MEVVANINIVQGALIKKETLPETLTKPVKINSGSKWCFGKVNMDTPMYEKMKFSARKLSSSNICFVRVRESSDRLLYV